MSKITLSPNASGTGTFTIASPNSNVDRTLNLPDSNGTILTTATAGVPVNGPAFSAYASSNQSLTNNTSTKITFDIEEFDTGSCFSSSRFTPTVAGYYQFSSAISFAGATGVGTLELRKNGSQFKVGSTDTLDNIANTAVLGCLVYANGSTDYFEIYGYQNSGASLNVVGAGSTVYFQGFLARSAT